MTMLGDPPNASPVELDRLCDDVRALFAKARGRLPVLGLGVLQFDDASAVVLTYVDVFGTTAHRADPSTIPAAVWPQADGIGRVTATEVESKTPSLFEARVLLVG